jgi:hypothetical protein
MSHKSLMHGGGESYCGAVPAKQPNKSEGSPAEVVEGRPQTKENTQSLTAPDTEPGKRAKRAGACARSSEDVRFDARHPHIRGKNRVR